MKIKKSSPKIKIDIQNEIVKKRERLLNKVDSLEKLIQSQQELLESYYENMARFNNQKLELIKNKIIAQKESDQELVKEIQLKIDNSLKRSYLYSFNFAINNKNSEVAPYLAVAEVYDANVKYLDTINSVLPENIANSKYGIILQDYIKKIKSR